MTSGTVSGMLISDLIAGDSNEWTQLYDPGRINFWNSISRFTEQNYNVAKRFILDRLNVRRQILELDKGEADIFRSGSSKIAVYKDYEGDLHTFSAACPHMGCILQWNNADETWDCPCHGSRFKATGEVIHGPSKSDLGSKSL